ncbi:MAG: redox-sensing transcriptional repressor Rex [Bacilli bacterium]|nr:redox-sensing transcriptional repressor Rex [Bacilli bacterium]
MKPFSKNQLERYPLYLRYFKELQEQGFQLAPSPAIASRLGISEELVRKDLQAVCKEKGRPRKGRDVASTIAALERFLGYGKPEHAILIGVGNLGGALLHFGGFADSGLCFDAAFDASYQVSGKQIAGKNVYPMSALPSYIKAKKVRLAVITVPSEAAQSVATLLVENGIVGIWNFAPVTLKVPKSVVVENVDLSSSLAVLFHHMKEQGGPNHW